MRRPASSLWICVGFWAGSLALPAVAHADRESPLAGQPAVRHKLELREKRIEIAPTFEGSVSADFKYTLSGGVKVEYHLFDWLSFGGLIFFGGGVNTGLYNQILDSLPATDDMFPTPSRATAEAHANRIPLHGGLGATLTPWAGKLSLFGKIFAHYDIYFSGGFGFAQTKNDFDGDDKATVCDRNCNDADVTKHVFDDPRNDGPHNAGFNPGIQFGGGFHFYFTQFAALDIYLRDYMFADNPAGLDFNGDFKVDDDDRRFLSHLFVGIGVSIYLSPKAAISK
jgi:outer membrane beta-barrel protein